MNEQFLPTGRALREDPDPRQGLEVSGGGLTFDNAGIDHVSDAAVRLFGGGVSAPNRVSLGLPIDAFP